jgi:hypothetical protein
MPTAEQRMEDEIALAERTKSEQERAQLSDFADQLSDLNAQLRDLMQRFERVRYTKQCPDIDCAIQMLDDAIIGCHEEVRDWDEHYG